ncbi:MAG TPA: hypothetical protein VIA45_05850 [Thermoanaerobaculia bacterium]|jgi:hypothetical protein
MHDVTGARLEYEAPNEVQAVIAGIGRTEDLALSPDNRRLVILDYFGKRLFVFSLRIEAAGMAPRVTLSDFAIMHSGSLREAHGVAFLGNDHIAVCNRSGDVCLYGIPVSGLDPRERTAEPLARIPGHGLFSARVLTPGSVASHEVARNRYRLLVCNNTWNAITAHRVSLGESIRIHNEGILIESRLKIPDGISISRDGAWIAVSNHVDGEVLVYENRPGLRRRTPPSASLGGLVCPHGVRFTADGRVLVADAGSQYLHAFERTNGSWKDVPQPTTSVRVVDDDTFYAGRYDSREGGVKGIEVDRADRVLMTTHKRDVLAFYDLTGLLSRADAVDPSEMEELRRQRDSSLERTKHDVVNRRWTFPARVRLGITSVFRRNWNRIAAARTRAALSRLDLRNERSSESLLDPAGPVVSLTTQPHRLQLVHYAIESIASGTRKPSRFHLWITDERSYADLPAALRRLEARGLEIHLADDQGPHSKYRPYVDGENGFASPLVTADDDVLYPPDWLEQLIRGHEANPSAIHCFRAHRIRMAGGRPAPYNSWTPCGDSRPSHRNLITGVSGVIYPPEYLRHLKRHGMDFMRFCPHSDDIWLTVMALRGGFKVAQLFDEPRLFPTIPNSQTKRLYDLNVTMGENQVQLMRTLSKADLAALLAS